VKPLLERAVERDVLREHRCRSENSRGSDAGDKETGDDVQMLHGKRPFSRLGQPVRGSKARRRRLFSSLTG
jgi:hypothetical protein